VCLTKTDTNTILLEPKIASLYVSFDGLAPTVTGEIAKVTTEFEYEYSLVDATAGYQCCLCDGLLFVPYGGVRALWYSTHAKEKIEDASGTSCGVEGDISWLKDDYTAVGFVGGMRFTYSLFNKFNLFWSVAGSILSGENDRSSRYVNTGSDDGDIDMSHKETTCYAVTSLEGNIGIEWIHCWCEKKVHIGLVYDMQHWYNMFEPLGNGFNSGYAVNDILENKEGLTLHAIALRLGIDF